MDRDIAILLLGIVIIFSVGIGIINFIGPSEEKNRIEAKKIFDFRDADHTCSELVNLYLKYYPNRYESSNNLKWKWETTDKLVDQGCITQKKLNNLEYIETCMDGSSVGCEISKLQYPELYEDFNFKSQLLKTIKEAQQNFSNVNPQ